MITLGYTGITAMITLNIWVFYTPKAPIFGGRRRGDEGKLWFSRLNHRLISLLRLPCQDCIVLDILASVFFAFLSFALLRFLDGILKGDTRRMYSNLQRFMIDEFKAKDNYSETLFINVLPL